METMNFDEQLKRELSFDLYGRYAIIRDIVNKNRKNREVFRILDVGGRGNLLRRFLPNDEVFYLDPFIESADENFIPGDGCAMPLEDESFDWVASADVFEHIPEFKRESFLNENIRVSKFGVVLVAPFYSNLVHQAEVNANENFKILSNGEDHVWLMEHLENGLPKEEFVESFLESKGIQFQKLSNNQIFLWELLIGISLNNFVATKTCVEYQKLNFFYNQNIYPFDTGEPGYRRIFFMKKKPDLLEIDAQDKPIDNLLFLQVIKMYLDIVNNINIQDNDNLIRSQCQLETSQSAIKEQLRVIAELETQLHFVKSSKFWKLREKYLNFKKCYGK